MTVEYREICDERYSHYRHCLVIGSTEHSFMNHTEYLDTVHKVRSVLGSYCESWNDNMLYSERGFVNMDDISTANWLITHLSPCIFRFKTKADAFMAKLHI